jgi:hypothetical protein
MSYQNLSKCWAYSCGIFGKKQYAGIVYSNPSLSIETAFVVTVMKPLIHSTYFLVVLHTNKSPSKKPVGMFDRTKRIRKN